MFDCTKDVRAFHNQEVTLPAEEQKAMRDRRDANRTRLRNGLEKAKKPAPIEFVKQGSYAMKTMIVHPDNDYRSEEHTSELQSLMRISYAVFCLKKKKNYIHTEKTTIRYTNKIKLVKI